MDQSEQTQRNHYNIIAHNYEKHYDDYWSQQYRNTFVYKPLFRGLNLNNNNILEAMCGSGQVTDFLITRGAVVTGLDISDQMIQSFKIRHPGVKVICTSMLDIKLDDASVDGVVIIGGLHHVQPHVSKVINEIYRVLKPSGFLCFYEPHQGSIFDVLRQLWYRFDGGMFESNERAINIVDLKKTFSHKFDFETEQYGGGLAYLFVYNSMIFRIPIYLKKFYSSILMLIDLLVEPLMGRKLSMFVLCRWRKNNSS